MTRTLIDEIASVLPTDSVPGFRLVFAASVVPKCSREDVERALYATCAYAHREHLAQSELTALAGGNGAGSLVTGGAVLAGPSYALVAIEGPEALLLEFAAGLLTVSPDAGLDSTAAVLRFGRRARTAAFSTGRVFAHITVLSFQSLVYQSVAPSGRGFAIFPAPAPTLAEDRRLNLLRDPEIAALLTYNTLDLVEAAVRNEQLSAADVPPLEILSRSLDPGRLPIAPHSRGPLTTLGQINDEGADLDGEDEGSDADPVCSGRDGRTEQLYSLPEFINLVYGDLFELISEPVQPVIDPVALIAGHAITKARDLA